MYCSNDTNILGLTQFAYQGSIWYINIHVFFQNNIAVDLFLIKKAIVVVRIYCSKYSFHENWNSSKVC